MYFLILVKLIQEAYSYDKEPRIGLPESKEKEGGKKLRANYICLYSILIKFLH
jgi:hypothetical protein